MNITLISLAFSAGLLTFLSPCSFAAFPIYIAYLINLRENKLISSLIAGLLASITASLTLLILGLISSIIVMELMAIYGYIKIALALILLILGLILISPREFIIPISIPTLRHSNFYLLSIAYGVTYALTSLACGLPVFLMIIFTSASSGGLFGLILTLTSYTLGLALPMIIIALITFYSKNIVIKMYRVTAPIFKKLCSILLIIAAIYLILY